MNVQSEASPFRGRNRLLADPALRLLEAPHARLVVRTDGLLVKISDLAWTLLTAESEELVFLIARYGKQTLESCDAELALLAEQVCGLVPQPFDLQTGPKGSPGGIVLMVAQACNLACGYCFGDGGRYGSSTALMSSEDALRAVDLMVARGGDRQQYTVTFFGGEPLLNFPVIAEVVTHCEAITEARGLEFHFAITTNGTILTPAILELLRSRRFGVMVSLDGPPDVHNDSRPFRNGSGSFERVVFNLRKMIAAGIKVQLRSTLTSGAVYGGVVREVLRLGSELGVERAVLATVDCSHLGSRELEISPNELDELETYCEEVTASQVKAARSGELGHIIYSPHANLMNSLMKGSAPGVGRCGACFGMVAVATDGKIYPCHRFVGMVAYEIGDIDKGIDGRQSAEFFAAVQRAYEPTCSACWLRDICHGTCFYHSADGRGGFHSPEPETCARYRRHIETTFECLANLSSEAQPVVQRFATAIRRF